MPFDRTDHEPKEYDPEAEFRDPDSDSLTIPEVSTNNESPSVSIPEVTTETEQLDVPSEVLTQFWALVLVLNAAILAVSLGALFFIFDRSTTLSPALLVVGVVLFGLAYRRYRAFEAIDRQAERDDEETTPESATPETETDTPESPIDADETPPDSDADETTSDEDTDKTTPDAET